MNNLTMNKWLNEQWLNLTMNKRELWRKINFWSNNTLYLVDRYLRFVMIIESKELYL